ncbi:AAA family ATPase [Mycoplasma sp. U97]|nr:AAA family ATPase [Mycoplasma tauri]
MIMYSDDEKKTIVTKGRFLTVKWGGAAVNWSKTLWVFESSEDKTKYFIYTDKKGIDQSYTYEVSLKKNSYKNSKYNSSSYSLLDFKIIQPDTNLEIIKVLIKNVSGLGAKSIEEMIKILPNGELKHVFDDPTLVQDILRPKVFENLLDFCETYRSSDYEFFVEHQLSDLWKILCDTFTEKNFVSRYKSGIDPYELYIDHRIKFDLVDKFAQAVCPDLNLNKRIRAYIYKILRSSFTEVLKMFSGNKYWSLKDFYEMYRDINADNNTLVEIGYLSQLLYLIFEDKNISLQNIIEVVNNMVQNEELIFNEEMRRVSLSEFYKMESFIVDQLIKIQKKKKVINIKKMPLEAFSNDQKEAYMSSIEEPISIITGYPGTGKSFLINHIVNTFLENKIYKKSDIAILTPTGRAATLLSKKTNLEARTIHSFLKLTVANEEDEDIFSFETKNPVKVVIIDEFSMVSLPIFYNILKICNEIEKLIIVGDQDQLPCIGKGNILDDLIKSKFFPTHKLLEVYRTDKNDIFEHFLAINKRQKPILDTHSVSFIELSNSMFLKNIESIYDEKVNKYSIEEVTLLLPSYLKKGEPGILEVNSILQHWNLKRTNAKTNIQLFSEFYFYVGDKVVQKINDYEKNVFNGEIGFVDSIENNVVTVRFNDDKLVTYEKKDLYDNLTLAYAITVHKFQGSESDCVIFGVLKDKVENMLTKKFMYTAVSRAKEELIIIGNKDLYLNKITSSSADPKFFTNFVKMLDLKKE